MDFSSELKKLLALEYNCSENAVFGAENVVTVSTGRRGRKYDADGGCFFSMATTGGGCLISADERLVPFLREFVKGGEGHFLFGEGKLLALERELERFGYKLNESGAHHMFLPKYSVELPQKFLMERMTPTEFKRFYGDKRFSNALCGEYDPERPDVIALAALEGDKIMGLAGASRDFSGTPSWLQIGIDVLPEYRGRGVGTFLVNELARLILESGIIPFYGTAPANIFSQNIAINCGFRPAWVEIAAQRIRPAGADISDREASIVDMKQELEDYLEEQGIYIRQ